MTFRMHLPSEKSRYRWAWAGVLLLVVSLAALHAYSDDHQLTSTWRGGLTGLLLLLYVGWILCGMFHRIPWWDSDFRVRLIAWFVALAIAVALVLISRDFIVVMWTLFGATPFYLGTRLGLIPMLGVLAMIGLVQAGGIDLPQTRSEWGSFAGWSLGAGVSILLIVAVERLVRQRIANEQLIADLQASQKQLRQAAVQERELLLLRERERFARDLHDIIGHALVLASVKLEAAQRLGPVDRERAAAELAATQQLLRQTMTELRQAVANLRAVPTGREDLAAVITGQVDEIVTQTGLRASMHIEPVGGLSLVQDEALRRVSQEALTNTVKHAGATEITITLGATQHGVELEIADNGCGFNQGTASVAGHFGVRGMVERMELAGGTLTVASTPGGGTRITAKTPLVPVDGQMPADRSEAARGVA